MIKKISDIVKVNTKFCRSTNIDSDFGDINILSNFICPTSFRIALLNMAENIKATGQTAFTWTGPYGSGKSSLALFLSSLIGKDKKSRSIVQNLFKSPQREEFYSKINVKDGWEILPVIGDKQDPSILLKDAISKKQGKKCTDIIKSIKEIANNSDGLLIIIDEMGKCLESVAKGNGDVYLFQQLAEYVSRSNGKIIIIGILHQAFAEYASYLPYTIRDEWIKIQGRFIDIPINTAGEEQIELISKAIVTNYISSSIKDVAEKTVDVVLKNRLIVSKDNLIQSLIHCWPISPVVVMLLVQISRKKFGQNQRSIFSFLSSGEPWAFRDFINSTSFVDNKMYMPEDLFDYLKFNLESSILSSSDSKIWNIATDVLVRCQARGSSLEHINILKTIALIDIFGGTSGLVSNEELLQVIYPKVNIKSIIKDLISWSVIIFKKHLNTYSIYEGSDFDIEKALNEAYVEVPALDIQKLVNIANFKPIIAKYYYHKYGSMRWLEVLFASVENYKEFLNNRYCNSNAVGFFVIFLPQNLSEEQRVSKIILDKNKFNFPVFMTVAKNTKIINGYLKELLALEWIQKNKNEIVGDRIARREIENRQLIIISLLETQLSEILTTSEWYKNGDAFGLIKQNEFSILASKVCEQIYSKTPIIRSELVNRTKPSRSANSALNNLLKNMVTYEGEELLGIKGFTPERGLFNILLQDTGIYSLIDNKIYAFRIPKTESLLGLWKITDLILKKAKHAISLVDIYEQWNKPPFGVKCGLHSFFALAYILSQKSKIVVYRDGIYISEINDLLVDYLVKSPKTISLKIIDVDDVKNDILPLIAQLLNTFQSKNQLPLNATLLVIARKLVQIIDTLPPWVLKTKMLSKRTIKFREIVKSANDPHRLLLEDVVKVFYDEVENKEGNKTTIIIKNLKESIEELVNIYSKTMTNIALLLMNELDVPIATPKNLEKLHERAKKIKGISGNFKIDAFIARISTFNSSLEDIAGIVSLANNKPPHDWIDLDIENAKKEILHLCTEFKKTELYTKVKNCPASRQAIAFIVGIGNKAEIIEGEFDLLLDMHSDVEVAKDKIKDAIKSIKNKNVLLTALTEVSVEYLKDKNE